MTLSASSEPYTWEYLDLQLRACKKAGYHVFSVDVDDMLDFVARERARGSGQQAPATERIGSIRQSILQEDGYLIERVNAGMGEWEYVIQYCGEYYATAPTEEIARSIVERAQQGPQLQRELYELYEAMCFPSR